MCSDAANWNNVEPVRGAVGSPCLTGGLRKAEGVLAEAAIAYLDSAVQYLAEGEAAVHSAVLADTDPWSEIHCQVFVASVVCKRPASV